MTDTNNSGRLEAIWLKRMRRGPMDSKDRAVLIAGKGLKDDANYGKKRQVTVLSSEQWEDVRATMGHDVDPATRRANLMVSGLRLPESRGRVLCVGDCRILINGETRPCRAMDESDAGLRHALDPDWRGGIYGEVLDGGEVAVGTAVSWED